MKYYLLEKSLERKDVGVAIGQTGYLLDLDFVPYIPRVNQLVSLPNCHGNLKNNKFPDFEPRIKFELSEKGKLADLVDIPDVTAEGMLVSPKFRDLLERFNLMEHRFYEGVVMAGVFYREYLMRGEGKLPLRTYYGYDITTGTPQPTGRRLLDSKNLPINYP